MRRHHLQLVDTLLPQLRVDLADPLQDLDGRCGWRSDLAAASISPIRLRFIHRPPSSVPSPSSTAWRSSWPLIEAGSIANVSIHDGDARDLLARCLRCLARLYLLYPDPWPKARHNKRRFVSDETLAQFPQVLEPGGLFLFASDIADYVGWTQEHVAAHGGFAAEGDPAMPFADWIETRYEAKARREGRRSAYLRFRRTP